MSRPFRVVVAPDKFKGSLRAEEAAAVLAQTLGRAPHVEVVQHPVADGGEGTVELALGLGYEPVVTTVTGPLRRPVEATFAVQGPRAVVEMASAAGLGLLPGPPSPATAWSAGTYGVGELILAAVERGATQVVVGAGGSATTDGGRGALAALGLDVATLARSDGDPTASVTALRERLGDLDLVVACDVDNPLLGPAGAATVYAPQKGADSDCVAALEERLTRWAETVANATGEDLREMHGAGAAGGLAFGLVAVAGARLVPGAELLLDLSGFDEVAATADLVVVGEGSLDPQSLRGKGPVGLARAVAARGTPVVAVAGRCELTPPQQREAGLHGVYCLDDLEADPDVCMRDARRLLELVAGRVADDWMPACKGGC